MFDKILSVKPEGTSILIIGHQVVLGVLEEAVSEEHLSQLRHYSTHVLSVEGAGRELTCQRHVPLQGRQGGDGDGAGQSERRSGGDPCGAGAARPVRPGGGPGRSGRPSGARSDHLQPAARPRRRNMSRDRLVLPYLRPEQGGGDSGPGTGQIFYQPDAADDWDEEDPDDDLDI
ncbi:hypothetical protein FJT64_009314 [Amphibalanus amphitrite]|uniref:Elongator complex protein 5 n=1 Tax=Amphibalanus amphitrite TaxID=1232801 RepID=A0A6A4VGM2_AMPAM|nr:hypothetical protein FJT64_009314 [Amphibalanus amphitrite]